MNDFTRRDFLAAAVGLTAAGLMPLTTGVAMAADKKTTLVRKGASRCAIRVEAGSPPSATHGAEELQKFLHEMSGATVPILAAGDDAKGQNVISIGAGPLAEEEYTVRTVPQGLEIRGGGKRGPMYGCYALLGGTLGCRWFTSTISKIPHRTTIEIGSLDLHGKPAFEYREPYFTEALDGDWAARNRTNGNFQNLTPEMGGHVTYGKFVHTFNQLIPPDQYFATHPEYFSEIKGVRVKDSSQLCLTNADVLRLSIAKVRDWIKENPDATIFSVSQNDCYNYCTCVNCAAVTKEEGAPSGLLLRFVNSVAAEIAKSNPGILIDTLAYQWSEDPPKLARPLPNVRIRLAPIGACVGHAFDGCDANKHPYANLQSWAAITSQLYMWHYATNFGHYLQPLPDMNEIGLDIPLVRRNGVVGLFYEGDYAGGGGGAFAEMKSYLMARLMWDTSQAPAPIVSEFIETVYGPAAPQIKQWQALLLSGLKKPGVHAYIGDPPTAGYFSDDVVAKGVSLFDSAEAAAHSSPVALDQVQRARLWLEYLQLERAAATDPARPALVKIVVDKIKKYGIQQVREGEPVKIFFARIDPEGTA